MMNLLAKEFILQHLLPAQLCQLSKVNFEISQFIRKNRLRLQQKKFENLSIECYNSKSSCHLISYDIPTNIKLSKEELMECLKPIRVETLHVSGEICFSLLDKDWLKDVKCVHMWSKGSREAIEKFLEKITVSKLTLLSSRIELDGLKVLDSMPFVEIISLFTAVFNREFFRKLKEKSKKGPGLSHVFLGRWRLIPFNEKDFINFLKNAKFQKNSKVELYEAVQQTSSKSFQTMLLELNEIPGWSVTLINEFNTTYVYKITTPNNVTIDLTSENIIMSS